MTNPSPIFQAHPHLCKMNQNSKDSYKKSNGIFSIKEIDVPKDVGDLLESLSNKTKKVRSTLSGNVKSNITIVEPSGGTSVTKKIVTSNLNPDEIRKIEVAVSELMESSDSSDLSDSESNMDC